VSHCTAQRRDDAAGASAPVELYVTSTCIASKITTPRCGRCIFFAAHRIALCEALLLDRVSLAFLG
jgi:hypothetical protein